MIKVPDYRFKNYTEPWEDKKLGEVSTSFSGGTPAAANKKYYGGEIPFIRSAEINSDTTELFLTKEGLDNSSAKLVKEGDILYALYGATSGEVGISKINGAINQAVLSIIPKNNYTSEFIMQWLRLQKKNITDKYLQGGQGNLSGSIVKELGIFFPTLPEQTDIGSFFQEIDQLISLQQRKLEVLKEQKKTYLKLLFPAKGQTKPALRFAGFEDEWTEVKLGDLILRGGSGGTPKSTVAKYYGGDIPFLSITDISNSGKYLKKTEKTITNEGLQNSSAWVVPEGAISLAMYASVGKLAILGIDCATSQAFYNMVFEDDIVRNFVYITLEKANIYNEWVSLISTGTQANLNAEKVKNFSFLHPNKPEQEAIGSFFQDIDKAIAKQEEKVNQLKESKQTLLRKMFI